MTKTRTVAEHLRRLGACDEAVEWASDYASPEGAWDACRRGDWMLWLLGTTVSAEHGPWTDGRKPLVACALDCALTVKHLWPSTWRQQIEDAVGVVGRWTRGEATAAAARKARQSLRAADAADHAADAAAHAADAAAYAADAAAHAADAAAHAADAHDADDAAYDARTKSLQESVDIVRRHFPKPPEVKS